MILDNDYYDDYYDEGMDSFDSIDYFSEATEYDAADLLVGIERSYCEAMIDQCKSEFASYVNEGEIGYVHEGELIDRIKEFIKRVWEKIKMYFRKFMNFLSRMFENVFKFYKKHVDEINAGCNGVRNFEGYRGLKSFSRISGVARIIATTAGFTNLGAEAVRGVTDTRYIGEKIAKITSDLCKKIAGYAEPSKFDWALKNALYGSEHKETIVYSQAEIANVLGSEVASVVASNQLKAIEACLRDASNTVNASEVSSTGVFTIVKKIIAIQTRAITKCSKAVKEVISQTNSYAHAAVSVAIEDGYNAHAPLKERIKRSAKGAAGRLIANSFGENAEFGDDTALMEAEEAYDYMQSIGVID